MENKVLRIIDANLNRAMEGIRVVEDVVRFVWNHKALAQKLKNLRSELKELSDDLPISKLELLKARKSDYDVGADLYSRGEGRRSDITEIITSNLKRTQEAIRVLEEFGKTFGQKFGRGFKALRFKVYDLEKEIVEVTAKKGRLDFDLYVITDPDSKYPHEEIAKKSIAGGAKIIQLRDKKVMLGEYFKYAKKIREITKKAGVTFIVNNYVDICKASDADGVHLGQQDVPISVAKELLGEEKIIGVSTHSVAQAIKAEKQGADYISVGPIFATPSKSGFMPVGTSIIREVKKKVKIPFVAIGGIDESNIREVLRAGAKHVAAIKAISTKRNITNAVKELRNLIRRKS